MRSLRSRSVKLAPFDPTLAPVTDPAAGPRHAEHVFTLRPSVTRRGGIRGDSVGEDGSRGFDRFTSRSRDVSRFLDDFLAPSG